MKDYCLMAKLLNIKIFHIFGMTGPSTNRESNPQNLLVGARSPLSSPFTISKGYCLFVCGGSLTSGQLVKGSFQTA